MAGLTTHVLDTAHGRPAAGVRIDLSSLSDDDSKRLVRSLRTNDDGRTDEPLLAPGEARAGRYELVFHVAAYFAGLRTGTADPPFLDRVPVHFAIADTQQHYHVPLLVSPWGYTTYRGS